MSHPSSKLGRQEQNEIQAKSGDVFTLVDYQGSDWLVVMDQDGDDILRIYGVNEEQLACLHAEIGKRLGLAPEVTITQLRALRDQIDIVIERDDNSRR